MRAYRLGAAVVAACVVAACGGAASSTTGSSGSAAAGSSPAATSGTAGSPEVLEDTGTPASGGAGGTTITVPLTTATRSDGSSYVAVQIVVGGGPPATVQLDTGSSGLLINSSAVGSQVTDTGQQLNEGFVSGDVSATLAQAPVTIGGVTTGGPIGVGLLHSTGSGDPFSGTDGVLGIATANGPTLDATLFTPVMQLPAPYDSGSVLDVGSGGSGTWTLGPVSEPAGAVSLPLVPVTDSPTTYPNGSPAFAKDLVLCWTIGSAGSTCGPTDFDLGNWTPALNSTTFASLGAQGEKLPAGTDITMADQQDQTLWAFTTGQTPAENLVELAPLGSATEFNTGIGYFFDNVLAFDYANSRLLVAPK